jgi:predicted SprT family Zn-dependent metalloprotease
VDNPAQLEEWTVDHSGRIVLRCKKCTQRLILLGLEEDWVSEGRTEFECKCGKRLTLRRDRSLEEVQEGHEHEADVGGGDLLPFVRNQRS